MGQNFNQKPYASGSLRAHVAILLLAAAAAISLIAMLWNVTMVALLRGRFGTAYKTVDSVTDKLYLGFVFLYVIIFCVTAFVFLMWLHRAYRNLPALGAVALDTTPGWAVGYFFIPFVNLFKPFQVVREMWHESAPDAGADEGFGGYSARSGTPALVGWWWALFIIANISMQASEQVLDGAETIEDLAMALRFITASHALFAVAAVLALVLVKRIDEMQETKFRRMVETGPPPPPESFEVSLTA